APRRGKGVGEGDAPRAPLHEPALRGALPPADGLDRRGSGRHRLMSADPDLEEELALTRLTRRTARRAWQFIRPYRWAVLSVMGIELLYVAAVSTGPHLIRRVIDVSIPDHNSRETALCAAALLGCYLSRWLLDFLEVRINVRTGQRILSDIRKS